MARKRRERERHEKEREGTDARKDRLIAPEVMLRSRPPPEVLYRLSRHEYR